MNRIKAFAKFVVNRIRAEIAEGKRYKETRDQIQAKFCNGCQEGHVCINTSGWCPYEEQVEQTVREELEKDVQ